VLPSTIYATHCKGGIILSLDVTCHFSKLLYSTGQEYQQPQNYILNNCYWSHWVSDKCQNSLL